MRLSQYFLHTSRDQPAEAQTVSHRLMLRAGLIRRLSSGIYSWLPMGLRVLQKVEAIVRSEMEKVGALEISMPMVQPAELWQESGRWQAYGAELLRLTDRHNNWFCLGPTHEEVITDVIRSGVNSYKQLPLIFFQIQTKFRDELRPRAGVMRGREFLMKDAYSVHIDQDSLTETYKLMSDAYEQIFNRIGLKFCRVAADSGSIGGSISHEFHVLAESGEDEIAISDDGKYAANVELAPTLAAADNPAPATRQLQTIKTDHCHSIEDLCTLLQINPAQTLKTLIILDRNEQLTALLLRGDHSLSEIKVCRLLGISPPLSLASADRISRELAANIGNIGPIGLKIPIIADHAAATMSDFVCGANSDGYHHTGVNWQRDCPRPGSADLRKVQNGDAVPDGNGKLTVQSGIEIGHIFQLGNKYSLAMGARVPDQSGKLHPLLMGCYGIGISRIVAAAIEQHNDKAGICWPLAIAPFQVVIIPIGSNRCPEAAQVAEDFYRELLDCGVEALLDDRDERVGHKLFDSELIGIPHRVVISEKTIASKRLEYQHRKDNAPIMKTVSQIKQILLPQDGP